MTASVYLIPAEEAARTAVDAALGEATSIMREHGMSETDVTAEFVGHAIDRMWDGEDREALRARAHAMVNTYVDGLFDGIGDEVAA